MVVKSTTSEDAMWDVIKYSDTEDSLDFSIGTYKKSAPRNA